MLLTETFVFSNLQKNIKGQIMSIVIEILRKRVDAAGSQTKAAQELGVSIPYLHEILNGRRDPGPKILAALNMRKVVTFEPIGDVADRVVKNLRP